MLPGQSKVELYAALRRDSRWHVEPGVAVQVRRHLEHGQQGLPSAWPQPRTTTASARPSKLDPFTPLIDEILLIDLDATRKQRHTVTPDLPPSDRRALLVRGVALTT
ncbi:MULTISPECIES: hypothetical protein [unclassified Streptomyces]|uniref:hypothetical protein n=1 Tax=unclassified Streptomyces TaxID=2593676 RepID=UPI00225BA0E6|nr:MULTISPECIES: hypothetical protein [unclassified Streptomyces]MCX4885171.1 hypothetical protein [Streptomyces sp. NBC_00847]MCX5425039.1 hypothetical protein [Streptomyces sp. NBC_00078]